MGIVEGSCGYRASVVSIEGKFDLSRNVGCKTRGVAKNSSDPRQAYPEVKLQGWDLVRAVGIVGAGTRRKFVLSNHRGEMGTGDVCRVPLAAVRHRRAR